MPSLVHARVIRFVEGQIAGSILHHITLDGGGQSRTLKGRCWYASQPTVFLSSRDSSYALISYPKTPVELRELAGLFILFEVTSLYQQLSPLPVTVAIHRHMTFRSDLRGNVTCAQDT
jgi:hypothetical protein